MAARQSATLQAVAAGISSDKRVKRLSGAKKTRSGTLRQFKGGVAGEYHPLEGVTETLEVVAGRGRLSPARFVAIIFKCQLILFIA
jgi:hypothetical protein